MESQAAAVRWLVDLVPALVLSRLLFFCTVMHEAPTQWSDRHVRGQCYHCCGLKEYLRTSFAKSTLFASPCKHLSAETDCSLHRLSDFPLIDVGREQGSLNRCLTATQILHLSAVSSVTNETHV